MDVDTVKTIVRNCLNDYGITVSDMGDGTYKVTSIHAFGGPTILGASDEFPGGAVLLPAASVFTADDGSGTSITIFAGTGIIQCRGIDTTTLQPLG